MTENVAYLGMCTQCRQANAKEGEGEKASKTRGRNQFTKTLIGKGYVFCSKGNWNQVEILSRGLRQPFLYLRKTTSSISSMENELERNSHKTAKPTHRLI